MEDDDYELLPHNEIEHLRKEVATMKRNSSSKNDSKGDSKNDSKIGVANDLSESIEKLNYSINKLLSILQDAQDDIVEEYQNSKPVEKLNQLLEQNETIARALISINENMKNGGQQTQQQTSQMKQPIQQQVQSQMAEQDMGLSLNLQSSIPNMPTLPNSSSSFVQNSQPSFKQGMPPLENPPLFAAPPSFGAPRAPFMQPPPLNMSPQTIPMAQTMNRQINTMASANPSTIQLSNQQMPTPANQNMDQSFNQSYSQNFIPQPVQSNFPQPEGSDTSLDPTNLPSLDDLSSQNPLPPLDDSNMLPEKKKKFLGII